jgi:membrane-bound lytic murein transglycosylase D
MPPLPFRPPLAATLTALGALLLTGCVTVPVAAPTTDPAPATASSGTPDTPYALQAPKRRSAPVIPSGPLQVIAVETPEPVLAVASIAAPTDLWERMRRSFALAELDTDLVRQHEQWYASRPDYLQRMTERASKYLFHIVEEIERRGMPMELALLPFIESAFNPQAVSRVKAAGMWQFMPATGQSFDLKQNAFRDDRRDVLASTRAALDYLEQLHQRFGDWHLALAAYNWGQGNVNRAITRNRQAGLDTGYQDLTMPAETRHYVPKLQAVKNIVAHPERFQATLPAIGNHPFFDSVPIERDMDVAVIAELAEVSVTDFRQLNPSFNKPVIMAAGTPTILLPWDNAVLFERKLKTWNQPLASWTAWVVPKTMNPADAAQLHGISERELREVNAIPPRMMVRAGSTLLVPRSGKLDRDVPEHVADNGQVLLAPDARRLTVKVAKGDTLSSIARRHKVTLAKLLEWNRMKRTDPIRIGQTLVVFQPLGAPPATAVAKPARTTTTTSQTKVASTSSTSSKRKVP